MKLGLDVFLEQFVNRFKGKRVGLVTNMTGVNSQLVPTIDLFFQHPDIHLTALYGPEHGIRGDVKEGEKIDSSIDLYTKLPVYSLYGNSKKPSKEMLDLVDVVVFDLQDIGARYYTFIYTMAYVMEACAEQNKHFVVLDRPNPISGLSMEGNLVEEDVRSFVGLYPIPNRHAMTVGELAQLFNHEYGIGCELTVVPMSGWNRKDYFDETGLFWVPPSPNTTGMDMCVLYPGTCLVEGTNLSEGRGTTRPFEIIGAPFIDGHQLAKRLNKKKLTGILARPTSFMPMYQKHQNQVCGGIQIHVVNRREIHSLKVGLTLLEIIAEMYPTDFEIIKHENGRYMFDLLAGTKKLKEMLLQGKTSDFLEENYLKLERFRKQRQPYLLYN
ncbi:DUF1343 domain-containing protein [Bacillus sp. 31A1R]|uniref:DUF1343 domain-containing protein n=1 Tax=Robertmurraya mangrovi TaxID=3098077 RepID=A0ABU5J2S3_9BACI|nr:DUF1343 domain-containing protein [Bacillus sp. 31A1R]MDZ5473708.1 DUF1343 domain-containing protein [Bacillus sp. 31A1R]